MVEENSLIFPVDFFPAVSHIYDSGKYILVFCEKTVAERWKCQETEKILVKKF